MTSFLFNRESSLPSQPLDDQDHVIGPILFTEHQSPMDSLQRSKHAPSLFSYGPGLYSSMAFKQVPYEQHFDEAVNTHESSVALFGNC